MGKRIICITVIIALFCVFACIKYDRINLCMTYLANHTSDYGQFVYETNVNPDGFSSKKYNPVRHAGTLYSMYLCERVLKNNKYIKTAEVNKNFFYTITITIKEHDVLFKNSNNKYVLENSSEITSNKNIRVPRLVNYTPEDKYKKLITNMSEIDKGVLGKISEISYDPNDFDKDRFLLLMDDGNSVFLTLTKFEMINYYDDVLGQLEGRKGILYLDSGNHFKIME